MTDKRALSLVTMEDSLSGHVVCYSLPFFRLLMFVCVRVLSCAVITYVIILFSTEPLVLSVLANEKARDIFSDR